MIAFLTEIRYTQNSGKGPSAENRALKLFLQQAYTIVIKFFLQTEQDLLETNRRICKPHSELKQYRSILRNK